MYVYISPLGLFSVVLSPQSLQSRQVLNPGLYNDLRVDKLTEKCVYCRGRKINAQINKKKIAANLKSK